MWVVPISVVGLVAGGAEATAPPALAPPPRAVVNPRPESLVFLDGEVVAVDGRSVTVRGLKAIVHGATAGWASPTGHEMAEAGNPLTVYFPDKVLLARKCVKTRTRVELVLANGDEVAFRREDEPARRFPVGPALAAGGYRVDQPAAYTYRLADVRVGDEVTVWCELVGAVDTCYAIMINRRPGGRVPPAPGQKADDGVIHHDRANAYQDFEERGIPLPEDLRPGAGDEETAFRKLLVWKRQQERIAPPPREARPKP